MRKFKNSYLNFVTFFMPTGAKLRESVLFRPSFFHVIKCGTLIFIATITEATKQTATRTTIFSFYWSIGTKLGIAYAFFEIYISPVWFAFDKPIGKHYFEVWSIFAWHIRTGVLHIERWIITADRICLTDCQNGDQTRNNKDIQVPCNCEKKWFIKRMMDLKVYSIIKMWDLTHFALLTLYCFKKLPEINYRKNMETNLF